MQGMMPAEFQRRAALLLTARILDGEGPANRKQYAAALGKDPSNVSRLCSGEIGFHFEAWRALQIVDPEGALMMADLAGEAMGLTWSLTAKSESRPKHRKDSASDAMTALLELGMSVGHAMNASIEGPDEALLLSRITKAEHACKALRASLVGASKVVEVRRPA